MAKKVVLAGACRTAIGKMGGALSNTPAADLGAIVIKEALNRAGVKPEQVDEVMMGCVIQAAQGQNVARQASIKAGLPVEVPAMTLNIVCGSGLKCVNEAANMIMAGQADIVVAGGMENMSMAPFAATKARFGYRMNNGVLVDTMINDALTDAFNHYHMMITAENVAEKYGLTREELDEFSANSQQKCEAAINAGKFDDEIDKFLGRAGIGIISDYEDQPLIISSKFGNFAIVTVGKINNVNAIARAAFDAGISHFSESSDGELNPTEIVAMLICRKQSIVEGIRYAQNMIDGSCSILLLIEGRIYAARDRFGRTPVIIGKNDFGYVAASESSSFLNLGYEYVRDLGPGEAVQLTRDGITDIIAPGTRKQICSFRSTLPPASPTPVSDMPSGTAMPVQFPTNVPL